MVMKKYDIIGAMEVDVKSAVAEIESTTDLLERALKLSALAEKGLAAPSRRTTARAEARAALRAFTAATCDAAGSGE